MQSIVIDSGDHVEVENKIKLWKKGWDDVDVAFFTWNVSKTVLINDVSLSITAYTFDKGM
jgi:hypothetical protein